MFILIGFSLRGVLERIGLEGLRELAPTVVGVVLAVLLSRLVWVLSSDIFLWALQRAGLRRARPLGRRQGSILAWTGMRGVVTLAVALTVPVGMPGRDLMLVAAFAVILVTVVIQGSSLGWLIRRLRPVDADPPPAMDLAAAEAAVASARLAYVEREAVDTDGTVIHPMWLEDSRRRERATQRYASDAESFTPGFHAHVDIVLATVAVGRAELIRLHREGLIEDEVLHDLERDLDVEETAALYQRGAQPNP